MNITPIYMTRLIGYTIRLVVIEPIEFPNELQIVEKPGNYQVIFSMKNNCFVRVKLNDTSTKLSFDQVTYINYRVLLLI